MHKRAAAHTARELIDFLRTPAEVGHEKLQLVRGGSSDLRKSDEEWTDRRDVGLTRLPGSAYVRGPFRTIRQQWLGRNSDWKKANQKPVFRANNTITAGDSPLPSRPIHFQIEICCRLTEGCLRRGLPMAACHSLRGKAREKIKVKSKHDMSM